MIERDIKYTYQDWWEGKIYFGGAISGSKEELEQFQKNVSFAHFKQLTEQDERKVQKKQTEIFLKTIKIYLKGAKEWFHKTYMASAEKQIYVSGLIQDIESVFNYKFPESQPADFPITFRQLKVPLTLNDIIIIRRYAESQIINGVRYHGFIQSPHQTSKLFTYCHELTSEYLYQFLRWLNKNHPQDDGSLKKHGNEKDVPPSFNFSAKFQSRFRGQPTTLASRLEELLLDLKGKEIHYVNETTTRPNFKKIFSGREIYNQIKWIGSVAELSFFIKELLKQGVIEEVQDKHWSIAINCFEAKNKFNEQITNEMLRSAGLPHADSKTKIEKMVAELISNSQH